jgi:hypothetical protein
MSSGEDLGNYIWAEGLESRILVEKSLRKEGFRGTFIGKLGSGFVNVILLIRKLDIKINAVIQINFILLDSKGYVAYFPTSREHFTSSTFSTRYR